jgi:hypothetical protein
VASTKQRDRGGVDVDTALSWLTQREFSTDAIGHAVRRMAETGTAEQMIALSIALRQAIRAGGARG